MTPTEITALLACCASADNRKPNPEMVQFWTAALGDLDFIACRDAVVAHYQESTEWIMPAHIRSRVRRERRDRIAHGVVDLPDGEDPDLAIHMPDGFDPDDTAAYIRVLKAGRNALANGHDLPQPQGLVRRSIRELGGPARRVNELEDNDRRTYAERAKAANRAALAELAAAPEPEPELAPVFTCEHREADDPCGRPAPHLSADRRRPVCGAHVDLEESA